MLEIGHLPRRPGVYIFWALDVPLYVGKAKSLRARVANYLPAGDGRPRIAEMVSRATRVEVILTRDAGQALQLEQRLICEYHPPYNIRLREGHGYPYLAVRLTDARPRLRMIDERAEKGLVYFGPYPSAKYAREILKLLNRILPYRVGKLNWESGLHGLDDKRDYQAALQANEGEYRRALDQALSFLRGDSKEIRETLTSQMKQASGMQDFERAGRLRDLLLELDALVVEQKGLRALDNIDVIGLATSDAGGAVEIFTIRDGAIANGESFIAETFDGSKEELLESFCLEYYGNHIPAAKIITQVTVTGLGGFLSQIRGSSVRLQWARRGEKAELLHLAQENARLALLPTKPTQEKRDPSEALKGLGQLIGIEPPKRIECYDVSHIQDTEPVASMVVFENGRKKKSHYRTFTLSEGGADDCTRIKEVLRRRISNDKDESFKARPDLVVIDGGRGQLNAALDIYKTLEDPPPVIGLAKREEEIYRAGSAPLRLPRETPALLLLMQIRDEAHRVAIGFHRTRRNKGATRSSLDIPGIGPARRRALLRHFGSIAAIEQATEEELAQVVPEAIARRLWTQLR